MLAAEDDGLVVEELGLCQGSARVDVALINGAIHGYEIKSDRDDLSRFGQQLSFYNRTLELATIVVGHAHLQAVRQCLPTWWGITAARTASGQVTLHPLRKARPNRNLDPLSVVELLWRDEVLEELETHGAAKGMGRKPRKLLWSRLAEVVSTDDLCALVRRRLKSRHSWRSAE